MQCLLVEQKLKEEAAFESTGNRKILLTDNEIKELKMAKQVTETAIHPDT